MNTVAGRATFVGRAPRAYAFVHRQVPSTPARPDQFVSRADVDPDERLTVVGDAAGEFVNAVECSHLARGRTLDWFHIATKFKAAENAMRGCKTVESCERPMLECEIQGAKWLV